MTCNCTSGSRLSLAHAPLRNVTRVTPALAHSLPVQRAYGKAGRTYVLGEAPYLTL